MLHSSGSLTHLIFRFAVPLTAIFVLAISGLVIWADRARADTPHGIAPTSNTETQSSVALSETRGLVYALGRSQPRSLDVFAPEGASGLPVVILLHGNPPDRVRMEPLAMRIAQRGVVVFNISTSHFADNGGLVTDWFDDASCALVYAVARAAEYGGDSNNIVLAGYSGGAGVAAAVALNPRLVAGRCVEIPKQFPRSKAVVSIAGDYYNSQFVQDLRNGTAYDQAFWVRAFENDTARMDRYLKLLDVDSLMRRREARHIEVALVGGMPLNDNIAPLSTWFSFINAAGIGGYDVSMRLVSGSTHMSFITPGTRAFNISADVVADVALRLD